MSSEPGPHDAGCAGRRGRDGGAVRDHGDLAVIDGVALAQPVAPGLGHDHHRVGGVGGRLEDRSLVGGRRSQDRVGHEDRRSHEAFEEADHGVSVRAVVDAVLVLDDHDVGVAQRARGVGAVRVDAVVAQAHDLDRGAARLAGPR